MRYKASLDPVAKTITVFVSVLFALLFFGIYLLIGDELPVVSILVSAVLILSYGLCYGFRPLSYSITKEELIIHRPLSNIRINRSVISSSQIIDRSVTGFTIRTFASGGLFGYFGRFWSSKLGALTYYATDRSNMVLIILKSNKKIIVTPNEALRFVSEMTTLS